jgi:hypothetical protein
MRPASRSERKTITKIATTGTSTENERGKTDVKTSVSIGIQQDYIKFKEDTVLPLSYDY